MTDDAPSRGVRAVDGDSIQRAIQVLRDAGFAVDGVTDAQRDEDGHGVVFGVTVFDPNRVGSLEPGGGSDD